MTDTRSLPKISIVVVTFNAAATLDVCLQSIFRQEYRNLELVIADGGSTDGTLEIIARHESRISQWKSEPDKGIYDAMNKALDLVTGDWVYFLGADDELFPAFSDLAFSIARPNGIYYGSVLTRGLKRWGEQDDYNQAKHGIFHQAIIYPSAVFRKYRYELKYPVFADAVINMRCHGDPEFEFVFRDFIVARFNHTGTSGNVRDPQFEKDRSGLILRNFGLIIWLRYQLRLLKRRLAGKGD